MASQVTLATPGLGSAVASTAADATGHYIVPGEARLVVLRFTNTAGSPITVTFDDPNTPTPESAVQFNPDVTVSVPATTGVRYVVLTRARLRRFRDAATGRVSWTYSSATNVGVEASSV